MGSGTIAILMVVALVTNGVIFLLWKLMDRATRSNWLLHEHVDEVRALLPAAKEGEGCVSLSYEFERFDDLGTRHDLVAITLEGHRFLPEGMQLELALNGDPPLADDGRGHYIDLLTDRTIASLTTGRTLRELQVLFTQTKGVGTKGITFDPHAPRVTLTLVCSSRLFKGATDDATHIAQLTQALAPFATWLRSWEPAAHTEPARWAALYQGAKDATHLELVLGMLGLGETYEQFFIQHAMHGLQATKIKLFEHDPETFLRVSDPATCLAFFKAYTPRHAHISPRAFAQRFHMLLPFVILHEKKMPPDYRLELMLAWSNHKEIDRQLLDQVIDAIPHKELDAMRKLLGTDAYEDRRVGGISLMSADEGKLSVVKDE
jgi:hypothetical protein